MKQMVGNICLVDDDKIYLHIMKSYIQMDSLAENIVVCLNGEEALNYLIATLRARENLPDVILLDLNMPVMDGWDFLEEFDKLKHRIEKKLIIYVVSSSINDSDHMRAKQIESVENIFVKPMNRQQLRELMDCVALH